MRLISLGLMGVFFWVPSVVLALPAPPHDLASAVTCSDCHVPFGGSGGAQHLAATGGGATWAVFAGASFAAGAWKGGVVTFAGTGDANEGQYRMITSNTADTVTWDLPVTDNPTGTTLVLSRTTQEDIAALCLSCHNPTGTAASMSDVGLHQVNGGATTVGCGACHEPHNIESNSGQGAGLIRSVPHWRPSRAPVSYPSGQPDNDFLAGGPSFNGICEACHVNTNFHRNSAAGNHSHNVTRACVDCHVHGQGFVANCDSCHAYPPPTGAHETHVVANVQDCSACHFGNNHNPTNLTTTPAQFLADYDRNQVDLAFDPAGFNRDANNGPELGAPLFTPGASSSLSSCSNLTCHNPDNAVTGRGDGVTAGLKSANQPVWGATIATCLNCHVTLAVGADIDGGSHSIHASPSSSYGQPVDCVECHAGVNIVDPLVLPHDTRHGDTQLQTDQDSGYPILVKADLPHRASVTAQYSDGPPGSFTGSSCSAVYCHGSAEFSSGMAVDKTWTWGGTFSSTCGSCHFNYSNLISSNNRSHVVHSGHPSYPYGPSLGGVGGCSKCHSLGAQHADGRVSLVSSADGSLAATTRCDICHGDIAGVAEAKANWNINTTASRARILRCVACHNGVDPGNADINGFGDDAPATDSYYLTGHGRSVGYAATGNMGADLDCTLCHDRDLPHLNVSAAYTGRLKSVATDSLAYTDATSELCLDCHRPGQAISGALGVDAQAEAMVHSGGVWDKFNTAAAGAFPAYGDRLDYGSEPGYQCSACHDAHGTSKLAMVRATLTTRFGASTQDRAVAGLESSDSDLRDLDPSTADDDGVCDLCHAAGAAPHADTAQPGHHHQGQTGRACVSCHDHSKSFAASVPDIQIEESSGLPDDGQVEFGLVVVSVAREVSVVIRNAGTGDLSLGPVASVDPLTSPFSISGDLCSGQVLAPSASCVLDLQFRPGATGLQTDTFDVPSNDPDTPSVSIVLRGTGTPDGPDLTVIDPTPPSDDLQVAFGDVRVSTSVDQLVTLRNDGTQPLTFGSLGLVQGLSAPLSLAADSCSGQTLAPSAQCSLTLRMSPIAFGLHSQNLDIPSNDPDESSVSLAVTATGKWPVYAYVTSYNSDVVSELRLDDNSLIRSIPVGFRPQAIAVAPGGKTAYVLNWAASSLSVVDIPSGSRVDDPFGGFANALGVAVTRSGAYYAYVTAASNTLWVRHSSDDSPVYNVPTGAGCFGVVASPDGSRWYVSHANDHELGAYRMSDGSLIGNAPAGNGARGVAVTPDSREVYVANTFVNTVTVVRAADLQVLANIGVGNQPYYVAIDPSGARAYVTNNQSHTISVIDTVTRAVIKTVAVGQNPAGVAVHPDGTRVYVANSTDNNVSVIDTSSLVVVGSISTGLRPSAHGRFIQNDDPNAVQADIEVLDAANPADDGAVVWGGITGGTSSTLTFTLRNQGDADLVLNSLPSVDVLDPVFVILSDPCGGQTLLPTQSCTVTLRFSPPAVTGTTNYSSTIDIGSNDPDENPVRVTLVGVALP